MEEMSCKNCKLHKFECTGHIDYSPCKDYERKQEVNIMEQNEMIETAIVAIRKNMDYETLYYSDLMYGKEKFTDEVWEYVIECEEIGNIAFEAKYIKKDKPFTLTDIPRPWSTDEMKEEKTYVPFLNCGWKSSEDGCCLHPSNATPECHQFICPIKAIQQTVSMRCLCGEPAVINDTWCEACFPDTGR